MGLCPFLISPAVLRITRQAYTGNAFRLKHRVRPAEILCCSGMEFPYPFALAKFPGARAQSKAPATNAMISGVRALFLNSEGEVNKKPNRLMARGRDIPSCVHPTKKQGKMKIW